MLFRELMEKEEEPIDQSRKASTGSAVSVRRPYSLKKRVAILGVGQLASEVCRILRAKRWSNVEVVGFIEQDCLPLSMVSGAGVVIGRSDRLQEIVVEYHIDTIAVCVEDRRAGFPVRSLLDCKARGVEVIDGHELYEEKSGRISIDQLRPSALIFSTGFRRRSVIMGLKRGIDMALSSIGLVILVPLFLLISVLIKLDSPGSVFYRQLRVGLRGQPYMIWKFRSMYNDAEKSGPRWAEQQDPRVSRVGRILRKLRLDELPQLYNVLRGEMSLVGPRPERPVFVEQLRKVIPYYELRHTVRPGLTGWAQTQFRYGATAEDAHAKLQYDLYYVKNMTFLLDMRVLFETVRVVLLAEGAR